MQNYLSQEFQKQKGYLRKECKLGKKPHSAFESLLLVLQFGFRIWVQMFPKAQPFILE